jgi:hypothetical protein
MSTTPAAPHRHALGLPAGSIRALLALGVLGYLWMLLYLMITGKGDDDAHVLMRQQASLSFLYMQCLMVLILAHFFSAHGHTIGGTVSRRSPLGLPAGTMRVLLLAGYLGLAAWAYSQEVKFNLPETAPLVPMLAILMTGYLVGYIVSHVMRFLSGGGLPGWFQDVQAWFAMLGLVLFGVVLLVRLVINTSVPFESQIGLGGVEAILAAIVGFYFGSRS